MSKPLKIVYITPSIHTADGAARVLTMKANYFAEHFGYDITILLTEGKGLPFFYPGLRFKLRTALELSLLEEIFHIYS